MRKKIKCVYCGNYYPPLNVFKDFNSNDICQNCYMFELRTLERQIEKQNRQADFNLINMFFTQ